MPQLAAAEVDKLIGQKIQKRRKELGYSAEKLAEYIDLSQQQISRYERGASKINVSHLIDIAVFLQTPISWFFQDCLPKELYADSLPINNIEQKWNSLTNEQKSNFITLLDSIRNNQ
ncbi:helix-turn-helix transcriptional regulator [Aggregatibacter actinomycetemcomitans]|uniref:helix-turn-helix domain-containing protein n=1 Tax=Aggregatibacter actinomycetemcomitans TaxID=714 RepID=UPI00197C5FF3|nr:helix-turn-helix transcriptional regulator [Aggregatibacter actinomycetemcomitans]MBN6074569.1 helix-turn-helix transcriptional regulator [Aggregatibacter actinomycetemcomitans]